MWKPWRLICRYAKSAESELIMATVEDELSVLQSGEVREAAAGRDGSLCNGIPAKYRRGILAYKLFDMCTAM
jgi:hypothetical protein